LDSPLARAVVLVRSADPAIGAFGTAFVIHRASDSSEAFLLTCAHVARDVTGQEGDVTGAASIVADGMPAVVFAVSAPGHPLDLAVLRVSGNLNDETGVPRPVLPLARAAGVQTGDAFVTAGYQSFASLRLLRPLRGTLGASVTLTGTTGGDHAVGWDLNLEGGDFGLKEGYSGAPVASEKTGLVVAITSHAIGSEGKKGLALTVEGLETLWPGRPAALLAPRAAVAAAALPRPPAFSTVKQRVLEKRVAYLTKNWEAAMEQINLTLSAVDRNILQQQADHIEQEIRAVQQELAALVL